MFIGGVAEFGNVCVVRRKTTTVISYNITCKHDLTTYKTTWRRHRTKKTQIETGTHTHRLRTLVWLHSMAVAVAAASGVRFTHIQHSHSIFILLIVPTEMTSCIMHSIRTFHKSFNRYAQAWHGTARQTTVRCHTYCVHSSTVLTETWQQ